ncbi:conjugative transfer relaxase/helicase TraI [Escherichia coli]|nr:conjugative transfer relaxase/helicase TraI [Escherichia coli]
MYRPGMVMEQWNPETRSHDRYVIDRVTAQSHSLTLRDAQGETQVVRISSLDSSWSLFRPEKMPVADGERLRVTGKIPGLRVSGGDRLQVTSVSEDAMTVVVPGRAEPASLPVADSPFTALKLENCWVETPGHSVSDSATVFASVTQMAMDNATLNGLARSGRDVRLYSSLDETRTAEKLARHPSFTVVSEQIKTRAGETSLETAISHQKSALHTPAQQAIHLALPVLESKNLAFSHVDLLTEAKSFAAEGTSFTELGREIDAQIKRGDLLHVDVAKGYGTDLLVSRASYEAEKSILRHILEGKEAVTPLMERVPGELMEKLTSGQRAATRMILETSDRFTVVQGYAGVGKTTQFRAVMSAVNMLPESERPRVVGLGPTHRAVGEMRSAGVDAQTLASFLHDTQLQQRSGETPDFSNTLFLLDESSMVGNTDMARAYALIAAGGGRAVASGDTDQLQAIAPGQPFRLQQTRSAADVAIMKEIVRQTPELREAVYSLINRDVERALSGLESVKPSQVPRQEGAWAPEHSVTEFSHSQEAKLAEAQQKAMLKGEAFPDVPMTLYEAIVRDYTGRTPEAREQTLIVTHLNEDRRVLNSMIHDVREKAGELGKEQVMVPVLNTANIRDGELRRLSTWETHRDALVLVDNVYHRIAGISKDDGLITLQDAEGNTRLISPREAVAEGVTLYTPDTIRVGTGDRMRFTKSDRERGYVANSVWTVTAVSGDSVTLSDGQQTREIRPGQEQAEQHIDLAYAITAHGAQGASETFAIALEGTEGNRKLMAGFESAYVALSRMKQHVQVYTDKICCRSVCSRWNGIWFVTCRKRKPWAETDTGRQTLMTTDNTNTRNDSLAARTDTWLQSLLVWSPGQRDIIKTVALVLMVLDHINLIFQLKQEWMFLAGRGAFPLFALVWGLNLSRHAHIRQVAINRLWGWAVIAQFAYYLAGFPWYEGNILFAFAVAAQVLTWYETRSGWRTAAAILLMALWGPLSGTSYGIAGLLMLAVSHRLYRAEDRTERLALVACLLAVIPALNLATSDAAAVAGLVMTVLTVGLVSCAGKSLPRFWPGDFFPTFYACHLAVLGVLAL